MKELTRRYFLLRIVSDTKLTSEQLIELINDSARRNFGELGLSRVNPRIIKFDMSSSTTVVSCEPRATNEFGAALALITGNAEGPVRILVLRISGTIKGASRRRK